VPRPGQPLPGQPRKSNTLKIVLIVVGSVFAVCCIGGVTGGYFLVRHIIDSTQPERDAVHTFLRDLEDGDLASAYNDLCSDTRHQYTQAEFTDHVAQQPHLASHEVTAFDINSSNGETDASVTAMLHFTDGTSERHIFQLAKDSGTWHVCGDPY
jgi:hypothetical protein